MRVVVEKYNPEWQSQFGQMKQELESILSADQYISIEHVGSTSVPGLAAKPVLDIDVVVKQDQVKPATLELESFGYTYLGEMGVPQRHAFREPDTKRRCNLYVCVENSVSLQNHLAVRDMCRKHESIRDRYGELKLELAQREWSSVDEYCEAKNETIGWILNQAGMNEREVDEIRQINTTTRTTQAVFDDKTSQTPDLIGP